MKIAIVGGSDAGISAALRVRELDSSADVTVVVADNYPNFSICGIPYFVSGDVGRWENLAHRTETDLTNTGMKLMLNARASRIDVAARELKVQGEQGDEVVSYDELIVGTGAISSRPNIAGLNELGPRDGVHLLHSMGDTFALMESLERINPRRALIVGAGYIGLEMAEAFTALGIHVIQVERHEEVLATLDPSLGFLVRQELESNGVEVYTNTSVNRIERNAADSALVVHGTSAESDAQWSVDLVLIVVGVQPDTQLLTTAGAVTGHRGAVLVDEAMATTLPHVWAAGDCVVTHHRQLGVTYLPLGTTSHKQGRVAGENALGGSARFAGSLGTQVVKVFDLVAARTGLRHHEALAAGYVAKTTDTIADDHKAYYPGSTPITISVTGDRETGLLLGAQMVGRRGSETAKRIDTFASALFHSMTVAQISELDLSYTPPLGSPWDAVQIATQQWGSEITSFLETPSLPSRKLQGSSLSSRTKMAWHLLRDIFEQITARVVTILEELGVKSTRIDG